MGRQIAGSVRALRRSPAPFARRSVCPDPPLWDYCSSEAPGRVCAGEQTSHVAESLNDAEHVIHFGRWGSGGKLVHSSAGTAKLVLRATG
jgi:hypothetical protein